jgi:RNA polymerase sigma factor (sigma-70 family)
MPGDLEFSDPFPSAPARGSFPTTHWSMVLHAGAGSETQVRAALETLCRQYWYPLYVFVRRQGRSHHEAEDCTQEFLGRLLASESIARARPERGRFRSFLLSALRNFLTNEWHRSQATKRGGGMSVMSLDAQEAERRFANEPAAIDLTPEQAFDRTWATGLIDQAFAELKSEYEKSGRGALFSALSPLAWGDGEIDSAPIGERVGLSARTLAVALHRLRRRLAERLRARVAETVGDKSDIEGELRHLVTALQSTGGRGQ